MRVEVEVTATGQADVSIDDFIGELAALPINPPKDYPMRNRVNMVTMTLGTLLGVLTKMPDDLIAETSLQVKQKVASLLRDQLRRWETAPSTEPAA